MTIKLFIFLSILGILFLSMPFASAEPKLDISAKSAILVVADTGEILYEKNCHERLPMASTTKIMTSLIALESDYLQKEIIVSKDMVSVEGTSMGLLEGDRVTLKALIYGMMLKSGNDAANAVALTLADSKENFAELMNQKAKELKMYNTNFETPSGLDSKSHYSTAYDMALLGCEAAKNPQFAYICAQKQKVLYYGNPPYRRVIKNHNRLLWEYDGADGIKTGFTKKSGRCLVSTAKRNGVKLLAVTLNAPKDWQDHKKLFDYGFSIVNNQEIKSSIKTVSLKIAGGTKSRVKVETQYVPEIPKVKGKNNEITEKIYLKRFEYAPLKKGAVVGEARYYKENKLICTIPILTEEEAYQKK